MLDFLKISTRTPKKDLIEIYPSFQILKSSDLMIRGSDFYAVWVESRGLWSTDEQDALDMIDRALDVYANEHREQFLSQLPDMKVRVMHIRDAETRMIDSWHRYCQKQMRDSYHMLDEKLIFSNDPSKKEDYASKRLPYPLEPCDTPAYEKLISTLYTAEERHKIEWAIGAIVTGDSKKIQKFMVLYGAAGTGKSTILNIIQKLFEGYYSVFDAKALGSSTASFALEAFRKNPLVAIQHDGDLSRIEDNTRLNSLVSHELMTVNEKYKSSYENHFKCFLFLGTNRPVRITDGKSGLLRRLIDVTPSGKKLSQEEYKLAVKQVEFELGGIAAHCRDVYLANPSAYDDYVPVSMLGASNDFYNFVLDSYYIFQKEDGTSLKASWEMYKTYCDEAKVPYPYSQRVFKEELKNYFWVYKDQMKSEDGTVTRGYFSGFRTDKFEDHMTTLSEKSAKPDSENWLDFKEQHSKLDDILKDAFAQYAKVDETPSRSWEKVKTKLSMLNTKRLHYVLFPEEEKKRHIVIDFDIRDESGNKSLEKNIEAAKSWPKTYAELSKSGSGIHLHYIYTGDVSRLSRIFDEGIEVKVFTGNSPLRRKLTKCNDLDISTISSNLPLKGEEKVINWDGIKSERMLRVMIKKNLNKEYHAFTKPSIDYIYKLLTNAYESGLHYDVTDLRQAVLAFAASSSNQSEYCIRLVTQMPFKSDEASENFDTSEAPIAFYDVEVFPNLFLVNWKLQGKDKQVVRMINPKPSEIEELMQFRLVGFNNRRYDNHILYGRMIGYSNEQLFQLSQRIIGQSPNAFFGEAYNISYTDIYDFAAKKQSLKKWEIELGIHHKELGLPWDQPVPEERWLEVAEYCDNDVIATEAVFDHLAGDWTARQILSNLASMTVNDTTNSLTTRIIFGRERHPKLVYTDLATGKTDPPEWQKKDIITAFPGYEYKDGKNMFRGDDLGKGGYVYAEPGMYWNVALLDIASLHPNSIRAMNCFGEYTKNFTDILDARVFIKHGDFESVRHMFGGRLAPYLEDESTAKDLAQALKIAINSVYGLTSASFDNPFRDIRNKNNIVALRGALFMRTLQDEVKKRGFKVAHIKTDSIKIPNATQEIIDFCMDFAKKYGYTFEHEATYDRMCLVNDAVYIAKYLDGKHAGEWTATGTQFQIPYVFKTLFSREKVVFDDLCETKSVTSALYLDMNEGLPDVSALESERDRLVKKEPSISRTEINEEIAAGHNYIFVGKVGRFCPMVDGAGGGWLVREATDPKTGDKKFVSATGAKGFRWMESEMVQELGLDARIDMRYYRDLATEAIETIEKYGDFTTFVDEIPVIDDMPPFDDDAMTAFDVR